MADKLHKTKGIVLRVVKYGETSLVVTIYTELFGLQSYLVNGVRVTTKQGNNKAVMFQPSAILDLVVYHSEFKQLQRIKEHRWAHVYSGILSDVRKNAIALFMVELVTRCIKQPESNPELFGFLEDAFMSLDASSAEISANFPLYFAVHLPAFFGLRIDDNYSTSNAFLDLQEGSFVQEAPSHQHYIAGRLAAITAQLLRTQLPSELNQLKLNHEVRRELMQAFEVYYLLHVQDFGNMKTLPVLREILG